MSDLVIDFDFFNEFDLNSNSFDSWDQYLDCDNNSFDDKFESNIGFNSFLPIFNSDYHLNQIRNQFTNQYKDLQNQLSDHRLDLPLVSTSVDNTYIESAHTFVDTYQRESRVDTNCESLPSIRYDLESIENLHQTIEQLDNGSQTENLREGVTQFNGELISTEEFTKQNSPELFCTEQMSESHSPQYTQTNTIVRKDPITDSTQKHESIILGPDDSTVDINNNNCVIPSMKSNHKTYSQLNKTKSIAQKINDSDLETIDAVKSLVMLSNFRPQTSIRTKHKKGSKCQMSFAERQRQKRERNRIAAKKCRQKKLETIEKLEQMKDILVDENHKFETLLKNQRQRLTELKLFLLKHRLTDCQMKDF